MPRQGAPEPPHTQILGSWIIINICESQHEISEHTCALACAHTHIELLCIIGRKAQVNFWAFAPTFPCQAASYLCPAPRPHGLGTLAAPLGTDSLSAAVPAHYWKAPVSSSLALFLGAFTFFVGLLSYSCFNKLPQIWEWKTR